MLALLPGSFCFGQLASTDESIIEIGRGVHLLVDDFLIGSASNVVRRPVTLRRESLSEAPLITAANHHPFQPYFTILRDPGNGRFRMWYGIPTEDLNHSRSRIAYMESVDGIAWTNQHRILDIGPIQFGTSVIDDGPAARDPSQRYKLGWYMDDGLKIAVSADGIHWRQLTTNTVLRHNHDINGIFYNSLQQKYAAIVSFYDSGGNWAGRRRFTKQALSTNLLDWTEPRPILTPDSQDEGETQFYAMDGFLRRGGLIIGMVKVLRDDLKADDPPEPADAYGIGYTCVASTRDGLAWRRERTAFLERNPRKGAWDHAHAWIDEQVPAGDEVYLYYAGYKSGHKVNRFEERQIGLIRMKRDRYVAHEAPDEGVIRTRPLVLLGKRMFVNVDAAKGELRVRVITPQGEVKSSAQPIKEDSVKATVSWEKPLDTNAAVVLEFRLRNAAVYAIEME